MRIYSSSPILLYETNKSESWLYHYQFGYSIWTTLPSGPNKEPSYNHKCKFQTVWSLPVSHQDVEARALIINPLPHLTNITLMLLSTESLQCTHYNLK